jgi:biopolymer transport protein ExbD
VPSSDYREASAEPNLTPMLDMVFQLITFFMLVINFKSAQLDMNLKLPVIGSARPVDTKGQQDLLMLNINAQGELTVYNTPKDIDSYIAGEAQASLLAARQRNPNLQPGDDLPTTVVIRADRATPFHLLNRVIKACQDHGFRNFSLKAMTRAGEGET